ncbi:hypothetical protein [Methylotetracoccus oryzae]|uniref:hypothetical protein n=1 Tax=Methylotetracoccus oryzae TaxID=1919059 RepID=UPI001118078F|nr:hypothetical protein [Methylotetracoccus oryzae]
MPSRFARSAGLSFLAVCGSMVSPFSSAVTPPPVELHDIDNCDVGGGSADIQSVQTRYLRDTDELHVELRLCDYVLPQTVYTVHLDHAPPYLGEAGLNRATAGCRDPSDTIVQRRKGRHFGPGRSHAAGNRVRFRIPVSTLDVDPKALGAHVSVWVSSDLDGVRDHAPNTEHGDGCKHPQSKHEALATPLTVFGYIAFATLPTSEGFGDGYSGVNDACNFVAREAGLKGDFVPWVAANGLSPSLMVDPTKGPWQTLNGTVVANNLLDLMTCNKGTSGTDCLRAPLNRDVKGNPLPAGTLAWTNVTTAGVAAGPSCNDWTTISAGVTGTVGKIDSLGADWTDSGAVPCNTLASYYCLQVLR